VRKRNRVLITEKYLEEIGFQFQSLRYWTRLPKEKRSSIKWLVKNAVESNDLDLKRNTFWLVIKSFSCKNALKLSLYCALNSIEDFTYGSYEKSELTRIINSVNKVIKRDNEPNRKESENNSVVARKIACGLDLSDPNYTLAISCYFSLKAAATIYNDLRIENAVYSAVELDDPERTKSNHNK